MLRIYVEESDVPDGKQHVFSGIQEYLAQRRAVLGASQEEFADRLADFHDEFTGIDAQTVSRWELGKVSPSLSRQVQLIRFFGDEPSQLLSDRHFEIRQLPSLKSFDKHLQKELEFHHIHAAHPYVDSEVSFKKIRFIPKEVELYCQQMVAYLKNVSRGVEVWQAQQLMALVQQESCYRVFYLAENLLFGHLIALRLRPEVADELLQYRMHESELLPEHCVRVGEEHVLYFLTGYSGTRNVVADSFLELSQAVAENPLCLRLGLKMRTDFGIKNIALINAAKVCRGPVCEGRKQGVKDGGKRYESISYQISRDEVLASPLFLNLLRPQN